MTERSKRFKNLFDLADTEYEHLDNGSWFPFSTEYLVLRKKNCTKNKDVIDCVSKAHRKVRLS